MPALNRVQLIGNLGKDPQSRFTPKGSEVCQFSLAVNRRWRSDRETKEATDWFNIDAWGRQGKSARNTCTKAAWSSSKVACRPTATSTKERFVISPA